MTTLIIILVVVAVVLLGSAGALVTTRSRRGATGREPAPSRVAPPLRPQPTEGAVDTEAPPGAVTLTQPDERAISPPDDRDGAGTAVSEAPAPAPVLKERLGRARGLLSGYFDSIRRRSGVDAATFEELEEALILADVGVATTTSILVDLRDKVRTGAVDPSDPGMLLDALRGDLAAIFDGDDASLHRGEAGRPTVWLVVGVNGVGKTTTIGKLALRATRSGDTVVLAAGDTFRAAAGEQLETWAERADARIVRGSDGADPSSVIFDSVQHAASRGADLVIADTAGRLHTKVNLMEELRKVRRVAEREPGQLTEVLLVLDATTGQNGLVQARQFTEAVGVTGIVLTKLDGTAKGGIVLAIRSELGLPIKLVGVGEAPEDLVDFDPVEFVAAIFDT